MADTLNRDDEAMLFTVAHGGRMSNKYKLTQEQLRQDIMEYLFPMKTVKQWTGLPRQEVQSLSVEVVKT